MDRLHSRDGKVAPQRLQRLGHYDHGRPLVVPVELLNPPLALGRLLPFRSAQHGATDALRVRHLLVRRLGAVLQDVTHRRHGTGQLLGIWQCVRQQRILRAVRYVGWLRRPTLAHDPAQEGRRDGRVVVGCTKKSGPMQRGRYNRHRRQRGLYNRPRLQRGRYNRISALLGRKRIFPLHQRI